MALHDNIIVDNYEIDRCLNQIKYLYSESIGINIKMVVMLINHYMAV